MSDKKHFKKYTFTVEGQTEKWYLEWLRDLINAIPESEYTVVIDAKVQQSPYKFAKTVNPIAVPSATHICDYESNSAGDVQKFHGILEQLKNANKLKGRSFRYGLGYSNLTFELWMILHKAVCNGSFADKSQYLKPLNKAYDAKFLSLDQYKHESNFKWCLNQLTLENVKLAIVRSKKIMENNIKNGYVEKQVHGFRYYSENPSLTLWQSVEQILSDCKLL